MKIFQEPQSEHQYNSHSRYLFHYFDIRICHFLLPEPGINCIYLFLQSSTYYCPSKLIGISTGMLIGVKIPTNLDKDFGNNKTAKN